MIVFQVFLPFGFAYFLSYLFRVVNAVIAPNLISDLGLTAADLGLLTSANFFAFAAFQLPLGILLDRYGPRKTEACLLLIAAAGALVFGLAGDTPGLIAGRAMIGFGTSACLMAALKAYAHWIPNDRLPLITGFHMATGGMGALVATKPVEMALGFTDWRGVFFLLAGLTVLASILLMILVPKRDRAVSTETWGQLANGIRQVFRDPVFIRIAPTAVVVQSGYLGVQSLWSGPWLRDVAGLDQGAMADGLLGIAAWLGWRLGHQPDPQELALGFAMVAALLLGALVVWVALRRTCVALALAHRRALSDRPNARCWRRTGWVTGDEAALLLPLHGMGPVGVGVSSAA